MLGLRRLSRLLEHEPGDLTATVEAGMTVEAFQAALRGRGQWMSLDPADARRATIGGVLATNASGPRRHLYGTARDLLIGVTVVTADGAIVRGGGKVVKNVAGYDLPKLFVGSYGTLGVIVEATVKLRPLPDHERLVGIRFDRLKDAGAAARSVMASDLIPNAIELLDATAAAAFSTPRRGAGRGLRRAHGAGGLAVRGARAAGRRAAAGGTAQSLPADAWPRLASAARAAFPVAGRGDGVLGVAEPGRRDDGARRGRGARARLHQRVGGSRRRRRRARGGRLRRRAEGARGDRRRADRVARDGACAAAVTPRSSGRRSP